MLFNYHLKRSIWKTDKMVFNVHKLSHLFMRFYEIRAENGIRGATEIQGITKVTKQLNPPFFPLSK